MKIHIHTHIVGPPIRELLLKKGFVLAEVLECASPPYDLGTKFRIMNKYLDGL